MTDKSKSLRDLGEGEMTQPHMSEYYQPRPVSPAPVVQQQLVPAYPVGGGYLAGPTYYGITPPRRQSSAAVTALVLGVTGVFAGWCFLGVPCVAAIVAGHVGLSQTRGGDVDGRGMAVAGLVLGYVMTAPAIALFFTMVAGSIGGAA